MLVTMPPLLDGGGTHMITIGRRFLSPMTPGTHVVRIEGGYFGAGIFETYGFGFISLDFSYRVRVTRSRRLAGRCQGSCGHDGRPSSLARPGRRPSRRPWRRLLARCSHPGDEVAAALSRWARTNHWNCSSWRALPDEHVLGDRVGLLRARRWPRGAPR